MEADGNDQNGDGGIEALQARFANLDNADGGGANIPDWNVPVVRKKTMSSGSWEKAMPVSDKVFTNPRQPAERPMYERDVYYRKKYTDPEQRAE